jgi:hypothetical protein
MLMLEAPKHDLGYTIKPLPPIPSSAGSERRVSSAPAKTQHKKDDTGSNPAPSNVNDFTESKGQSDDSSFDTSRQNAISPEERVFLTQVLYSSYFTNK